jgi:formate hydrogenlyase subunit 3/multisubunit Na+/H+ antiporter MnhD subunit
MTLFFVGIALLVASGAAARVLQARPAFADGVFALGALAGCALGAVPALGVLAGAGGSPMPAAIWPFDGPIGPWVWGIDALSAVFVLIVLGVGAANMLFGISYMSADRDHRPVGTTHLLTTVFVASMALVVTARAAMPFLVSWEVMALSAYFLVITEDERPEVRRAGLVYLAATHAGTLALAAMFGLWGSQAGGFTFDALGAAAAAGIPAGGALLLSLALFGFGLKAGVVPLHFWLPGAHASAPSHVSGLMSGVLIKTGIYGLLRVLLLLGGAPAWWGWLVLGLGVASGILGVLWALVQHDLKRLLAYHSIENIGIILMGIGAGALGVTYGQPAMAVLGFTGAILHTANHALFKSLLFLGAGAVARASGTRVIDQLGGLARRMPATWLVFLIASAAIVGLPPLNGFVSEWLVFQSLFKGGLAGLGIRFAVLGVPALALIGGLALACFAKVCGVSFLGHARSRGAAGAREATPAALAPMVALALACIVIGCVPALVIGPIGMAASAVAHLTSADEATVFGPIAYAARDITVVAAGAVLVVALLWAWRHSLESRRPAVADDTWACGYAAPSVRMQYTAASFAAPLVVLAGPMAGLHTSRTPHAMHTEPVEIVLDRAVAPGWRRVRAFAELLRPVHQGRLQTYLLYMIAAVLALLLYLWVRSHST